MKHCILLLAILLMFSDRAESAFVIKSKNQTEQSEQTEIKQSRYHSLRNKIVRQALLKKLPGFHKSPYESEFPFGIISLAASLAGLICLGLVLLGSGAGGVLIVAGVIAAIVGIVFGGIGLKRPMKGYAIAGMILGIIDVVAVIAGIVVAALVVLTLSSC